MFQTEAKEEMGEAEEKKLFEDTVRKVKQAMIDRTITQAVESGDMEQFQKLLIQKNKYKNNFKIPE